VLTFAFLQIKFSPSVKRPCCPPQIHPDSDSLLSPGSLANGSPTSSILCRPPTPAGRQPGLLFPLPLAYLSADSFPLATRESADARPYEDFIPAPRSRWISKEAGRPPKLLDRLLHTRRGQIPRRMWVASPFAALRCCLQVA
jgi:hypothetical protein